MLQALEILFIFHDFPLLESWRVLNLRWWKEVNFVCCFRIRIRSVESSLKHATTWIFLARSRAAVSVDT